MTDKARGRAGSATEQKECFYSDVLSEEERAEIARQLAAPQHSTEMEVAMMGVMIWLVMARIAAADPAKALPLIRQGVDAICRALCTLWRQSQSAPAPNTRPAKGRPVAAMPSRP